MLKVILQVSGTSAPALRTCTCQLPVCICDGSMVKVIEVGLTTTTSLRTVSVLLGAGEVHTTTLFASKPVPTHSQGVVLHIVHAELGLTRARVGESGGRGRK